MPDALSPKLDAALDELEAAAAADLPTFDAAAEVLRALCRSADDKDIARFIDQARAFPLAKGLAWLASTACWYGNWYARTEGERFELLARYRQILDGAVRAIEPDRPAVTVGFPGGPDVV